MEIIGKVTHRLDLRQGTSAKGNSWQSQDYVIEYDYDKQYPHSLVLNFFGEEKIKEAAQLLRKDTIAKFQFDSDAREITTQSGKKMWTQTFRCYNFTVQNPDIFSTQTPPPPQQQYQQPATVPTASAVGNSDPIPQDDTSSLPF